MKASTVDALIWVLVYGGLLLAGLGLSVKRTAGGLGYGLIVFGGLTAAAGFTLIYVRSRMREAVQPPDHETP